MSNPELQLACLRDLRLATLAVAARPAWLWSTDAGAVLWSNAVAAAIFGASSPAVLAKRRFDTGQPTAAQIATLADSLPADGTVQEHKLRGFGAGVGRTLTCACSRLTLADGSAAILIAATERAGPELATTERARRALAELTAPLALVTPELTRIAATPAAMQRLAATPLTALDALAGRAREDGHAEGDSALGRVSIIRLDGALLVDLDPPAAPVETAAEETAEPIAEPAPEAVAEAAPEPAAEARPEPAAAASPEPAAQTSPEPVAEAAPEAVAEAAAEATPESIAEVTPEMVAEIEPDLFTAAEAKVEPTAEPVAEPATTEVSEATAALTADAEAAARSLADTVAQAPTSEVEALATSDEPPSATEAPATAEVPATPAQRRHPLRFVWQLDDEGSFTLESEEFLALVGAPTTDELGKAWTDIAAGLDLDADGAVARATATHDTWSGVTLNWPVEGTTERLPVEMSGLPIFDRGRGFRGYRGFGVCRDLTQIVALTQMRRSAPLKAQPKPELQAEPRPEARQAAEPPAPRASEERPVLTLVPQARNVVPFRSVSAGNEAAATLSPVERKAFRELARQLTARLKAPQKDAEPDDFDALTPGQPVDEPITIDMPAAEILAPDPAPAEIPLIATPPTAPVAPIVPAAQAVPALQPRGVPAERPILDQLPIGVLIHRGEDLCYANRAFLDWAGHADLDAMTAAGGLATLALAPAADGDAGQTVALSRGGGDKAQARQFTVTWDGDDASVLMLEGTAPSETQRSTEMALRLAEGDILELRSILDTATDGVLVLDRSGHVLSANRSAEALFGYDSHELAGKPFSTLFAPESERAAIDYLDGLIRNGVASVLNDGREVIGKVRGGGLIPLFMTMGRIADGTEKLAAVLRDITQWKKAEEELVNAKRQAEKASSAKSDFLAKISHEIRTPLNAIIGFSEVMMDERFGPVGNERYREYLKDIHTSGGHLVSLINDLLDLSKIEAGKLELNFGSVSLNDLTQQCVAIMQPQANRERIIIRSSLSTKLPQIVADARSVRQIVLNLVSNSIKFTGAAGQVIVSTALTDDGEVVLRVRDTGVGMSEQDIATALEPFRQLATSARWGSGGTGLGLPLTKALAEANRANFRIQSAPNAGTLVEVTFPATRVLAE